MAIQDSTVTVFGAPTFVRVVEIMPQADGTIILAVAGGTKDSLGRDVGLQNAHMRVAAGSVAAIDNLLTRALSELRKANGLEV